MISAQTAQQKIWSPLWHLPRRGELIFSLAKRDLLTRYKGSVLGIVWAIVTPVVTIAIFTFIFAGIFGARFGGSNSHWDYALYLFCGLVPWNMFQERFSSPQLQLPACQPVNELFSARNVASSQALSR
jgi:lipopolysaccharide transport system permease protein